MTSSVTHPGRTSSKARERTTPGRADVVVIGAGFGGLAAALRAAELGAKVVLLEALNYPGGCASTFSRGGHRFESGATLFSGFAEGQLFARWIERYGLDVTIDWIDPVVEMRAPDLALSVPRDRAEFERRFLSLPGAPVDALQRFFRRQKRVADLLWELLDDPALLPPFGFKGLFRHGLRLPRSLPLAAVVGRTLESVMRRDGVADFAPLRTFLDALCQITVQCGIAEAEAPFALGTMDYYFRGTGHVRGGIGALATELVKALEHLGVEVRFTDDARRIQREGAGWRVVTRRGEVLADQVIGNLLPQNLRQLLGAAEGDHPQLDRAAKEVESGWGACMLYLVARAPEGEPDQAHHLEIVQDPTQPFINGNHLFCSISGRADEGRAPEGQRTLTVSTHVPLAELRALPESEQVARIEAVQQRLREGLQRFAPEWWEGVETAMTASPRTFERFTRRFGGFVGGVPRRRGLHHYFRMAPPRLPAGLHLVGDTVFPGQSTLAAALGGLKVAERIVTPR